MVKLYLAICLIGLITFPNLARSELTELIVIQCGELSYISVTNPTEHTKLYRASLDIKLDQKINVYITVNCSGQVVNVYFKYQ